MSAVLPLHRLPSGWLTVVLLWLTACTPLPTPTVRLTPSPADPTSPTPTVTPLPGGQMTVTPSPSPTATPTPPPTIAPTFTPLACLSAGGRVEVHELPTALLPQPLRVRIYLPPCYDQQPARRYPVLYLLHGQSYTEQQWERLGATETADRLIAAGALPPFLIVMPRDRVWKQPSEDPFGQAIVETLLPYVDATYRTLAERRFRAIGGLSRGAAWAVHLGLSHWELFGAIGAHSLPVFFEDVPSINRWLKAIPPEQWPRIWVDIGDRDSENLRHSASWFEQQLQRQGMPYEYYIFAGGHDETYWSGHLERYLRWYAADW